MDIYKKYDVKRVINASGKMTILGGSRVSDLVVEAMKEGAQNFFVIKELKEELEKYLAQLMGVENTYLCTSASSGIAQCVNACISKTNKMYILNPYHSTIEKKEIIIPKGHVVDYGCPITLPIMMGGGCVVEVGCANECSSEDIVNSINANTAALIYVKSHHCVQKGMPSLEEVANIAIKYQLPLIVDGAAEEDLRKYLIDGVSAVIFSGTKALNGPTSGLVVGQGKMMQWLKLQTLGLGRVMKLGKEQMLGLARAVELYQNRQYFTLEEQKLRLKTFNDKLSSIDGIKATCVQDDAGREIIRSQVKFRDVCLGKHVADALKLGNPMIYTRDYRVNLGIIEIDIRDVSDAELNEIYEAIVKEVKL